MCGTVCTSSWLHILSWLLLWSDTHLLVCPPSHLNLIQGQLYFGTPGFKRPLLQVLKHRQHAAGVSVYVCCVPGSSPLYLLGFPYLFFLVWVPNRRAVF